MPPKTPVRKKIVKTTTPKTTRKTANSLKTATETTPETINSQKTSPETTATTPKTASPEITIPTTAPGTTPKVETDTASETTTPSGKTTIPKKTTTRKSAAAPKTTARKTTASPKISLKTTTTTINETNTCLEADISIARSTTSKTVTANATSETTIIDTTTATETSAFPETAAASGIATDPKTTVAPNGSSESIAAGTTTSLETATDPVITAAPNATSESPAVPERATTPETITESPAVPECSTAAETTTAPEDASKVTKPKTTIKVKKKIVKRKKVIRKPVGSATKLPPKEEEEEKEKTNPNPDQSIETEIPELKNPGQSPPAAHNDAPLDTPVAAENQIFCDQAVENETERGDLGAPQDDEMTVSERRRRRKTEIFIGGLDKDAKEEDIRKVFEKVGEIVEIRLMMNSQTGKNKGYAFLRYASATDAKRAVTELAKVEVCGKQCGTAAAEGNDTIFLGNIDKKWKKEDVTKILQEIGIDNIDTVTVMADPNDPSRNRGFAFLELETNKDAQNAYKKLQKKDVFGKDRHITVSWAEPLNDPDEEEMLKVKSVYVDGIPSSWDEDKVRKNFKKFGEIERIVLARNMQSARRKDFAFVNYKTRDSALACIESLKKEELIDDSSKVNVKVSLAKPVQKGKQSRGSKSSTKDYNKEKPKPVRRDTNISVPFNKGKYVRGAPGHIGGDKSSSTTQELIQVLREQASRGPGQTGPVRGSIAHDYQDYMYTMPGGKRPFSSLGDDAVYSDPRGYSRARLDSSFPVASSSYSTLSHSMTGTSLPYYQQPGASYTSGSLYEATDRSTTFQTRHTSAPYGSGVYPRY